MRIAPVVLPHLRHPGCELWADAALLGMVTHNDRASTAACVAFTAILWDVLCMDHAPEPIWWLEKYCQIAAPLEGSHTLYPSRRTNLRYKGPIWKFTLEQVKRAWDENWTTLQASNTWGSGAYLLETIPNVLLILMKYSHDPEQAIIRLSTIPVIMIQLRQSSVRRLERCTGSHPCRKDGSKGCSAGPTPAMMGMFLSSFIKSNKNSGSWHRFPVDGILRL